MTTITVLLALLINPLACLLCCPLLLPINHVCRIQPNNFLSFLTQPVALLFDSEAALQGFCKSLCMQSSRSLSCHSARLGLHHSPVDMIKLMSI